MFFQCVTTFTANELRLFVFYIIIILPVFPGVCYLNLDLGNIPTVLTMWINRKPHASVAVLISASRVSPCALGCIPFKCSTAIKLIFFFRLCLLCTQPNNTHNLIFSSDKAFMRGNDSWGAFSMLYVILMHLDTSAGMFSGVIMCCRACSATAWESLHPTAFVFFHLLSLLFPLPFFRLLSPGLELWGLREQLCVWR